MANARATAKTSIDSASLLPIGTRAPTHASEPSMTTLLAGLLLSACAAGAESSDGASGGPDGKADATGEGVRVDVVRFDAMMDAAGRSELVAIDIPADATSFTVVAVGDPLSEVCVIELRDPDGEVLVRDESRQPLLAADEPFDEAARSPNRASWGYGRSVLTVPNTPSVEVVPGQWSLRVGSILTRDGVATPMPGPIRGAIYIKRGEPTAPRVLPLHVHMTGEPLTRITPDGEVVDVSWTAEGAPDNAGLSHALTTVTEIYAEIGIDVEVASYRQAPPEFQDVETVAGSDNDLTRLLNTGQADVPGVNVFIVGSLGRGGLSGTTPNVGAPGVLPEEPPSGVVIANAVGVHGGNTMAHEIGHYLGLFHTTELDSSLDDPIDDTPTGLGAAEWSNTMFPRASSRRTRFTPEQGAVLRRSPVLVHPRSP
jgi:hypothetical protein